MNKSFPLLILGFLMLITSCNQPVKQEEPKQEPVPSGPRVAVPDFSGDSALEFARLQLAFGPRVPNTPAHAKCAAWLTSKMKSWTEHVTVQKGQVYAYNKTSLNFKNIIASWHPESDNRILLCAHWDSRPYADHDPDPANRRKPVEAANDGASGVAVLMELARQFSQTAPPVGIDIILFDVEDYGPPQDETTGQSEEFWGQGSQYWARNPHRKDYAARFGILLDMVGAKNATFLMEGVSMDYASDILKKVWSAGHRIGYSSNFIYQEGGYITDDHVPINKILSIPTIDIIHLDKSSSTGFYPYWHTTGDTFDKLDKNTLKAVGQTLLTVVFEEK